MNRRDVSHNTLNSTSHDAPSACVPFRVIDVYRVGPFGTRIGIGKFEIEGLGVVGFEINETQDRGISIDPESVLSRVTGRHERTIRFDPRFRAELLEIVVARLGADESDKAL